MNNEQTAPETETLQQANHRQACLILKSWGIGPDMLPEVKDLPETPLTKPDLEDWAEEWFQRDDVVPGY